MQEPIRIAVSWLAHGKGLVLPGYQTALSAGMDLMAAMTAGTASLSVLDTTVRFVPAFAPAGDLGGWAVGTTPAFLPENLSWTMNKGSDFILQLHLHPTGKPGQERSTIGLYFSNTPPPRRLRDLMAPGLFGALANIDIPAGEKSYVLKGTARTFANMRAYSVLAHAHYLGKEMKAIASRAAASPASRTAPTCSPVSSAKPAGSAAPTTPATGAINAIVPPDRAR